MIYDSSYLAHYGVLGMKWGIRRYQNSDGTLTDAGKARYDQGQYRYKSRNTKKIEAKIERMKEKGTFDTEKGKVLQRRLEYSKHKDVAYQEYASKTSVGKAIVQGLLFGSGTRTYQQNRALGKDRKTSAMAAVKKRLAIDAITIGSLGAASISAGLLITSDLTALLSAIPMSAVVVHYH